MAAAGAIRLVPLERRHVASTRAWTNDPELARLMNRARPVTEAEHEAWFADLRRRSDCAYFGIEQDADPTHIGNVWLWAIDERHRHAELRIVVGERTARGRGCGVAAIDLICRDAFERLRLHRVYAYVLAINPAARRAFEKAGFALEGTLREDRWAGDRFVDVYLLARLAPARPDVPA